MEAEKLLVIDSDQKFAKSFVGGLDQNGIDVAWSETAADGRYQASNMQPSVIMIDVNLPDANGFALFAELKRQENTRDAFFVITGSGIDEKIFSDHKRLKRHANAYLHKPFSIDEFRRLVFEEAPNDGAIAAPSPTPDEDLLDELDDLLGDVDDDGSDPATAEADLSELDEMLGGHPREASGQDDVEVVGEVAVPPPPPELPSVQSEVQEESEQPSASDFPNEAEILEEQEGDDLFAGAFDDAEQEIASRPVPPALPEMDGVAVADEIEEDTRAVETAAADDLAAAFTAESVLDDDNKSFEDAFGEAVDKIEEESLEEDVEADVGLEVGLFDDAVDLAEAEKEQATGFDMMGVEAGDSELDDDGSDAIGLSLDDGVVDESAGLTHFDPDVQPDLQIEEDTDLSDDAETDADDLIALEMAAEESVAVDEDELPEYEDASADGTVPSSSETSQIIDALNQRVADLEEALEEAKREAEESKEAAEKATLRIQDLEANIEDRSRFAEDLTQMQDEHEKEIVAQREQMEAEVNETAAALQAQIDGLGQQLSDLKKESASEIAAKQEELDKANNELEASQDELESVKEELEAAKEGLSQALDARESQQSQISELQERIDEMEAMHSAGMETQAEEFKNKNEEFSRRHEQQIGDLGQQLEQVRNERNAVQQQLEETIAELEQLRGDSAEARAAEAEAVQTMKHQLEIMKDRYLELDAKNKKNEKRVLKAYRKIKADQEQRAKSEKALAAAMELIKEGVE